ncbi:alpha-amylase family glycosyl hydrolase [Pseudoteredinibacter isoporae]|uniref:Alpha-glucosidase n=1 Tax=Pseudoteredinibacter isoporae TaxID=570281 RepID=A0A7X0MYX7_9GAMM|nr:alpha-glucosidase [Pseudoteredinibacter isoporae]NHO88072.1 alpha-glucosidase [Pseudoteredinibacter isoporae]NIB23597.1 alpha-glucosidase [Pseudoteredinibacter isoporae]
MTSVNTENWWQGAFIYQIYPRSFFDSNNDGIGDLPGIIEKLSYIAELGADAIWISPFFTSPMKDFGYDVADYRGVDPIFGELEDFKQLVKRAHELGLKVIIDQVLSHTSDQHAWFQSSRVNNDNDHSDWYVWAAPKADGSPPNNWLSFFGGSAWKFDSRREQYYFHNFLDCQPDLNFHNPQVQNAVLDVLKFWLDIGVDGFRFDTANMYFHDEQLRDNPSRDRSLAIGGMNPDNPRSYQAQIYNVNRPENIAFMEKIRQLLDQYPGRTSLGEIGSVEDTLGTMAAYTKGQQRLHMCYTADLLGEEKSAAFIRKVIETTTVQMEGGWPCWSLGNHDATRFISRWGHDVEDKTRFAKQMLCVLMCLRGSFCIYQGEELGLDEAELKLEELADPFGIAFWPEYKGRDGCRTPMVWSNEKLGGFSNGTSWLPIPQAHLNKAVSEQNHRDSLLNFVRQFSAYRKQHSALINGDIQFQNSCDDVLMFTRSNSEETLLGVFNLSSREQCLDLPPTWNTLSSPQAAEDFHDSKLTLKPWQYCLLTQ